MRWTFGVEPLPQTIEAAAALRRVAGLVVALEAPDPEVDRLLADLARAEAALAARVAAGPVPRVGAAVDTDGRVYVDHSRAIGAFNPVFPEYSLTVDGDRARGTVNFPLAYEGPPGLVHGGFLAVFFDAAMQHHHCDVGVAGKTTSLTLRYRRPTPLGVDLDVELERGLTSEGRLRSTGELRRDGEVLCTAVMEAVAGDRAALPAVSPRRPAS